MRVAAERCLHTLNKVTLRYCTSLDSVDESEALITSILPVIIEKGIKSSFKENRKFGYMLLFDLYRINTF